MKQVWLAAGLLVLLIVVWTMHDVLLLFFAAAVFAVPLRAGAVAVAARLRIAPGGGLAVVLIGLLCATAALFWLWEVMIAAQVAQLVAILPRAVESTARALRETPWASRLLTSVPDPGVLFSGAGGFIGTVRGIFGGTLAGLVDAAILVFAAVCFAAEPRTYVNGVLCLVPTSRRGRVDAVLSEAAGTVGLWLRARLISMVTIAALTMLGMRVLGVPDALALGIISGLFAFVPNIGPIAAAIPAILIASPLGWQRIALVILVYWIAHAIDDFFVIPIAERRVVRLPPALTIAAQLVLGLAAGLIGIMMAAPLVAVTTVLVRRLVVEDVVERGARVKAAEPVLLQR